MLIGLYRVVTFGTRVSLVSRVWETVESRVFCASLHESRATRRHTRCRFVARSCRRDVARENSGLIVTTLKLESRTGQMSQGSEQ